MGGHHKPAPAGGSVHFSAFKSTLKFQSSQPSTSKHHATTIAHHRIITLPDHNPLTSAFEQLLYSARYALMNSGGRYGPLRVACRIGLVDGPR